ncbi:MAG: DEAD/DEAH box helicase, partial [Gammaproteobacteria bacterium]|nr:DEAD/DEAH box helicase [Gammaproteobacteria bacterium]
MASVPNPLSLFHPGVRAWFESRYARPTDVQSRSWPVIMAGRNALITAPTGSGKTLTAFLAALDGFATGSLATGATRVLYLSPLKALNNDIRRNLLEPLADLTTTFAARDEHYPGVRVATRSGDTPGDERARLLRKPPEILVTTPESLQLMLTTPRGRQAL